MRHLLLVLIVVVIAGCSDDHAGATDTGNAFISGTLVDTNFNEVANLEVVIAPFDANPLSVDSLEYITCTTNTEGFFQSPRLTAGTYVLHTISSYKGVLQQVVVSNNTENKTGNLYMQETGSYLLTSKYFDASYPTSIFISGTNIVATKTENNQYLLDSIPASTIPMIEALYADQSTSSLESDIVLKEKEYAVSAGDLSVLFMVQGDTTKALTELIKRERTLLEELGFRVTTVNIETVTPDSASLGKYDLIYGSGSLTWDTNKEQWQKLPLPIATTSTDGYETLGLTDTTDGSYGTRVEATILTNVSKLSPPCFGTNWVTNSTTKPSEGGAIVWGKPSTDAYTFYKGNANQQEKFLFTYNKGDEMYNGITAPAGRIALYHRDVEVAQTGRAKNMIFRALLWGMDKF